MSTSSVSNSQRPYPLSPPPHSETKQAQDVSFHQPHTPESPLQPASGSTDRSSPATEVTGKVAAKPLLTPAHSTKGSITSSEGTEVSTTMEEAQLNVSMDIEDPSNKRKREMEDTGDQEQKKIHVEDRRLGIEDLHLDVGKKYLLCRTRKAPTSLNHLICTKRMCFKNHISQVFRVSYTTVFG
jgi:hypothetical protein